MRRGEVWWADLPEPLGRRLVVPLSRNEAYTPLNSAVVAPLTTRIRGARSFVRLTPESDNVPEVCVITLDNIQAVRQSRLDRMLTSLSEDRMQELDTALHFALGLRD